MTNLTFPQAIRKGCELRPKQCSGVFLSGKDMACVIGAALLGLGISSIRISFNDDSFDDLKSSALKKAGLENKVMRCPECRELRRSHDLAVHLNDNHLWKRERIADYFEGLLSPNGIEPGDHTETS